MSLGQVSPKEFVEKITTRRDMARHRPTGSNASALSIAF